MATGSVWQGRFTVTRELGTGGAGTVWEAQDERLGRTVAIKQLHVPSGASSRRFQREARIGASLRHPGLVTVYDVLCEDHVVLLVMEHVDGGSLADRLRDDPPSRDELLRILRDVAGALDHAHAHGVVHRDVKPANVLLGRDGRARLADLGIATAAESTRVTASGELLGTPAYLAPELVGGAAATPASDVYGLAAIAFEGLSGRRAHPGRNTLEILHRVRDEPTPDLRAAWPDAPPRTAAVVAAAMAARPEDRPPTATRFVDELEAALRPPPPRPVAVGPRAATPAPRAVPPRAAPAPAAPRRPRAALAAVAALLLTAGAVAAIVAFGGPDEGAGGDGGDRTAASAEPTREATDGGAAAGAEAGDGAEEQSSEATATPSADPTATATPDAPAEPGRSPRAAVRSFYELAAADDFAGAWALAGPQMQAAFGGSVSAFEADLSSLERITFQQLDVSDRTATSATVTVRTVAEHTDSTDRCSGPLRATKGADAVWRVDPAGISCSSG